MSADAVVIFSTIITYVVKSLINYNTRELMFARYSISTYL